MPFDPEDPKVNAIVGNGFTISFGGLIYACYNYT